MGIVAFYLLTTLIPEPELPDEVLRKQKEKVKPADGKKSEEQSLWTAGILTAVGISAHNVPEGIAVYIACLRGVGLGLPLALAIAAHNIPEGMAVASPILGATGSKWLALKYTLLSGLCEPAGALLVGYMFTGLLSEYVIHCMLAAVAGVMVLICLKELIPKCLEVYCYCYATCSALFNRYRHCLDTSILFGFFLTDVLLFASMFPRRRQRFGTWSAWLSWLCLCGFFTIASVSTNTRTTLTMATHIKHRATNLLINLLSVCMSVCICSWAQRA